MATPLGHQAKQLTDEEVDLLARDVACISDYQRSKLEREAKKNWDLFYKRNSTHFFKDRHWITREFPELIQLGKVTAGRPAVLEAGCGVGNTLFPLIEENPHIFVYACDFSDKAIEHIKLNSAYDESRCKVFQCDLTADDLAVTVSRVDMALLVFVLSTVTPEKMDKVVANVFKAWLSGDEIQKSLQSCSSPSIQVLKPGGHLFFRDYGLYDHAMVRFSCGHKITENFYTRQDGTRAYYFSEEKVQELFSGAGYTVLQNSYVQRETVNRKEDRSVQRIFVQGIFEKPQ